MRPLTAEGGGPIAALAGRNDMCRPSRSPSRPFLTFGRNRLLAPGCKIAARENGTAQRLKGRIGMWREFLRRESGVTLIEYGLIAGLIGIACMVILGSVGSDLNG